MSALDIAVVCLAAAILLWNVAREIAEAVKVRRDLRSPVFFPPPPPAPPPPPEPAVPELRIRRLLVEADEESGLLWPIVELHGHAGLESGALRVEVVDPAGEVYLGTLAAFGARLGTLAAFAAHESQLALHPFDPPADSTVAEVLGWRWVVVVEGPDGELDRSEHDLVGVALNAEAELEVR